MFSFNFNLKNFNFKFSFFCLTVTVLQCLAVDVSLTFQWGLSIFLLDFQGQNVVTVGVCVTTRRAQQQ